MDIILNNIKYGVQQWMIINTYNGISLTPQGESLECIIQNALEFSGYSCKGWTPKGKGSHRCGYDFICENLPEYGGQIQMKTGKWNGEYLCLTSSRTTKHKTLENKIKFMNEHKQDSLWSLSINEKNNKIILSIIKGKNVFCDKCDANNLEIKLNHNGNYIFKDINGLKNIKICASTSDQIYFDIHKNSIDYYKEIDLL